MDPNLRSFRSQEIETEDGNELRLRHKLVHTKWAHGNGRLIDHQKLTWQLPTAVLKTKFSTIYRTFFDVFGSLHGVSAIVMGKLIFLGWK